MSVINSLKNFVKQTLPSHSHSVNPSNTTQGSPNGSHTHTMPSGYGVSGPEQSQESWRDWFQQVFCPTCQGIEWIHLKEFDSWNRDQEYARYRVSTCKTCKKLSLIEKHEVKKQYDIEEKEPIAFLEKCIEKATEIKDEIMSIPTPNIYTTTHTATTYTTTTTSPPKSAKGQRPRPTPPPPQKSKTNSPKELDPPKYHKVVEYKPSEKLKGILKSLENANP